MMTNRLMMSVAAVALIAGTGLANAQATGAVSPAERRRSRPRHPPHLRRHPRQHLRQAAERVAPRSITLNLHPA